MGVFDQFRVDFDVGTFLFELLHVPLLLLVMIVGRRDCLGNFHIVVHIKASFGDILGVLLSLLLRLPLSLLDFQIYVYLQPRSVILPDIPWNIAVVIIFINGGGVDCVI